MNPKKTKLFSLLLLLLASFPERFDLHAQTVDPTVEFEFDSLEMDEASSMTICLELTNAVLDSEEKVEIYFKGSSLPFSRQQMQSITFQHYNK